MVDVHEIFFQLIHFLLDGFKLDCKLFFLKFVSECELLIFFSELIFFFVEKEFEIVELRFEVFDFFIPGIDHVSQLLVV